MGKFGMAGGFKIALRGSTAALALVTAGIPAARIDAARAQSASTPIEEVSRYHARLMHQQFDGARESSRSQTAGVARQHHGDESWTEVNFGNGAIVSTRPRNVAVGTFTNTSGVEAGLRYNHATRTLSGPADVADFHNSFIRPLLGQGPALGTDAQWSVTVTPAQLGLAGLGTQPMTIELSRHYFRHDGRDYVLIHYRLPSFTYSEQGRPIVHWGEGVALTDPGFGTLYWNATLHRAVAQEAGGSGRPYRYSRTMAAVDAHGRPLIDPRRIPEVAPYFARLYGHGNEEVMGYTQAGGESDQAPLGVATRLDILALSLGEDGGGIASETAASYASDSRGAETGNPAPRPLLARGQAGANAAPSPGAAATPAAVGGAGGRKAAGRSKQAGGPPRPPRDPTLGQNANDTVRGGYTGNTAVQYAGYAADSVEEATYFRRMNDAMQAWYSQSQALRQQFAAAQAQMEQSLEALRGAGPPTAHLRPQFAGLEQGLEDLAAQSAAKLQAYQAAIRNGANEAGIADAFRDYEAATEAYRAATDNYARVIGDRANFEFTRPPEVEELALRAKQEADEVLRLERQVAANAQEGVDLVNGVKSIPRTRFQTFMNGVSEGLRPLGFALDAYTIGSSLANFQNEMHQDPASGQISLSRQYDPTLAGEAGRQNYLAYWDLGLDLLSIAGAALSGDAPAAVSTAAAITTGSVTDIYLAARGLHATNELENEALALERDMDRQRSLQISRTRASMEADLREIRANLPAVVADARAEMDRAQQMSRDMLAERQRNREEAAREAAAQRAEAARQAEAERQRVIAAARAENERIYQQNLRRPPTAAEWAQFNRDIEAAMRPDYPTAPPPTPAQVAERLARAEEARRQRITEAASAAAATAAAAAAAAARAAAEAQARQDAVAEANAESVANRETAAQERRDRNDARAGQGHGTGPLGTGPVTVEPVVFSPPVWTPPVFHPPVWVPPEFDAPDPSVIPWTNFDGDNWLGDTGNLAYEYGDMSGRVETDLSRWAEWLATQNVRELTRLALLAGYPNLASALADAENLIRLSQDEGYRRWAMQQPSCGGYVGCGPSFLERWWMKQATVLLGDILAASRGIFSTGGFSDIGISGLNLAYLLRDNALQDGDIVRVRITQFGRTLYEGETNLTNLGDRFTHVLRQGVASLEIFAVNEGFSPPNTAQISLDNVVRGNATQSYSLRTGETATLRIETNARGQ